VSFRHVARGGRYLRVADPAWTDPLDGSYAAVRGGRWNPPGSFPVVYLNRDVETARANVRRRFVGQPFGIDDVQPERRPLLVHAEVGEASYVDVITEDGCDAAGLPPSYPLRLDGTPVPHAECRPIGQRAWDRDERGIACRSAALEAWPPGEELAWFQRGDERLGAAASEPFERWYWR
jgi:RES domain-containing protein